MTALPIALLAAFRSSVWSRLELETEILALRHQLAVLQRQAPRRPRLGDTDRLLWVLLSRLWPNWRRAVQIDDARHRRALASARVRALLAVEITATTGWPTGGGRRRPGADPAHARSQSALGRAPHPRRIAQARLRDLAVDGGQVSWTARRSPFSDLVCLHGHPLVRNGQHRVLRASGVACWRRYRARFDTPPLFLEGTTRKSWQDA